MSFAWAAVVTLAQVESAADEEYKIVKGPFEPTSESLKNYKVPQWYEDAKFGIYFHWAPFSVPAYKTEWYPRWMYSPSDMRKSFSDIPKHHIETWGSPDKFGYKDFIPIFTADKWDPDEWVSLFKQAGAKYVVSAAVHHDGFALWDSKHIPFNATVMGPKRDIVGEFMASARQAGLKTGVATHYGRHWRYYTFQPEYDTWDKRYEGLYGRRRNESEPPTPEDERHWQNVLKELINKYQPDYIYVDGGIGDGERMFKKPYFRQVFYNVLAHYYNSAQAWGKGVVLTYKREFLEPEQAVEDFERKGLDSIRFSSKWQTDDKISVQGWCYVKDTEFWPVEYLIAALVDTVSKNGNFLLSIGPKPDGTLRQEEVNALREFGRWLKVNGEAIYGSRPWRKFGHGRIVRPNVEPGAVRFTVNDGCLYATCFGWPQSQVFSIESLGNKDSISKKGIDSVEMLGVSKPLAWKQTSNTLEVTFPKEKPCDYAYVLKIRPKGELLFDRD